MVSTQTSFASEHVSCLGLETKGVAWTDLRFSDDDRFIAMTSSSGIVLLDAFHLIDVSARLDIWPGDLR